MSESYQTLGNEPLLANNAPPPPPPQNPYNNPNPSFNVPNPSFNNPNPSFNNQGFNNQGYINNQPYNNQGFNNQGYGNNQGFVPNQQINQPYQYAPVANVNCPMCRKETSSITRKRTGGVTWIWCFVLFILTGIFCCWVPFCVDSCKDTEVVCAICHVPKTVIPANCC